MTIYTNFFSRYVKTANSVVLDYSVKVRYRIFEYERPVCLVVGIELNHGGYSTGLGNGKPDWVDTQIK